VNTMVATSPVGVSPTKTAARWLLIAAHIGIIAVPPTFTSFGVPGGPASGNPVIAYPLAAGILALQVRQSFAFARGERPRHAAWSLLALIGLVYLPVVQFKWNWISFGSCVMASGAMLLPRRLRLAAVIAPLVGIVVAVAINSWGQPIGPTVYGAWYLTVSVFSIFVGLYASAWLLRFMNDLQDTRAELAEIAVGQERLRISRDLHDLLGQSLSAVALKGDLAIRLLPRNPNQARAEIGHGRQ